MIKLSLPRKKQSKTETDLEQPVGASVVSEAEAGENEPDVHQTHFAEDIVIEDVSAPGSVDSTTAPTDAKKKWLPIVGVVMVALFGLVTILSMLTQGNGTGSNTTNTVVPVEEATPAETALQRELLLLENDITAADPIQAKLAFPPVDFTLDLKDASVIQVEEAARSRSR